MPLPFKKYLPYRYGVDLPDRSWPSRRLEHAPIQSYEQITSLLRDGRKHKGVDFKAAVGTPVLAPFDGRIQKMNWAFRFNGNSLSLIESKTGREAILLHLSSIESGLRPGSSVRTGQAIARSGNTGRSTAPHLHYQLQAGKRTLDPFNIHHTYRVKLPDPEVAKVQTALELYAKLRRAHS